MMRAAHLPLSCATTMPLPTPSPDAQAHSDALRDHLLAAIAQSGGWISFAQFMDLALYTPQLGYYSGGARKFGAGGDFTTAPELTPWFARSVARQVAEVMAHSAPAIIEAGAGSGQLAVDLLLALEALGSLPDSYSILELSGELAARQRANLYRQCPHLADRVQWLHALPERFSGVVIGNEVLDAMPVHLLLWSAEGMQERGISAGHGDTPFLWADRLLKPGSRLEQAATALDQEFSLTPTADEAPYLSEISLAGPAWTSAWAERLERGILLLFDYGFPAHEYYHPQRAEGTLMCHYRHQAHGDPLILPGLQDITAHVDFTAIASAGHAAGLNIYGYTSQSQFLFNTGLLEAMSSLSPTDPEYIQAAAKVQKLISPAEMGELFKVIALGRGVPEPLLGFTHGDRLHAL